jgi:hypothetical protein
MKRRRNLIVVALFAIVAFIATACDVSDTASTSWQTNKGPAPDTVNVYTVARAGNLVILGGNFSSVISPAGTQSVPANGLAAFDAATGAFKWAANAGGTVYRAVADGPNLYVTGPFGLKKFNLNGQQDTSFHAQYNVGQTRGLAVGGGLIYYAGTSGIAAVRSNGTGVWRAGVDGQVWTLTYARNNAGARLIAGGYFCNVTPAHSSTKISRPGLASLGTNGAVDTRFNAVAFGCGKFDLARAVLDSTPYGTSVFVAGGGSLNRAAKVDVNTGTVQWASRPGDGDVQAVAVQGSYLYVGGHFSCVDGPPGAKCLVPRQKAARYLLINGSLATNWQPNFRQGFNGVWSIAGDDNALYVGGNFTQVNGQTHQKFVIFR